MNATQALALAAVGGVGYFAYNAREEARRQTYQEGARDMAITLVRPDVQALREAQVKDASSKFSQNLAMAAGCLAIAFGLGYASYK